MTLDSRMGPGFPKESGNDHPVTLCNIPGIRKTQVSFRYIIIRVYCSGVEMFSISFFCHVYVH